MAPIKKNKTKSIRSRKLNNSGEGKKPRKSLLGFTWFAYWMGITIVVIVAIYVIFNFARLINVYNGLNIEDVLADAENVKLDSYDETKKTFFVFESKDENGQPEIEAVYLFAYDDETADLLVVYIPGWVYVTPSYDGLTEQLSISNLRYAGGLVSKSEDFEYALWELENSVAISADSYVWISSESKKIWEEKLAGNKLNGENGIEYIDSLFKATSLSNLMFKSDDLVAFSEGIKSNLTVLEIYKDMGIYSELIRRENANIVDVSEDQALIEEVSSDGNNRFFYNYSYVDVRINDSVDALRGREIEKEQTKCEVYNGSSISGLAAQYTRKIQNNGLKVVRADNSPLPYAETTIYVSNSERFDHSLEAIKRVLPLEPAVVVGRPEFLTTGDIVVVLGEDYKDVYDWK